MIVAACRYPLGASNSGRRVRRLVNRPGSMPVNSMPISPGRYPFPRALSWSMVVMGWREYSIWYFEITSSLIYSQIGIHAHYNVDRYSGISLVTLLFLQYPHETK